MVHLVTDGEVLAAYLEGAREPLDRIRAAVRWAESQGLRILHGDYGVLPRLEWRVDPGRRPHGVSPLGAVVLAYQPPTGPDMPEPAAIALRVPIHWAEGFADGFDREITTRTLGPLTRRRYLEGHEAGAELRIEMTTRCRRDGVRHFKADECPVCEERP
jgi:hypothetical protein